VVEIVPETPKKEKHMDSADAALESISAKLAEK
jgi:hypothetical protein